MADKHTSAYSSRHQQDKRRHLTLPRPLIPMTRATTRRRISGKIQHVIIIGAGLAGLSAAARLRASGLDVTLLEAEDQVGGRCRTQTLTSAHGAFEADTGATVLTMPHLVEACVHALNQHMPTWWGVRKLNPSYTAEFASGRSISIHSDEAQMAAEIARFARDKASQYPSIDPEQLIAGYRSLRAWSQNMFHAAYENFLAADFDCLLDMVSTPASASDLARLAGMGAFAALGPATAAHVPDDELQRLFTFQALYAGTTPRSARAIYSVISHMDTTMGVYYPQHSIGQAAEAIKTALHASGVTLRLGARAHHFNLSANRKRISAVTLETGETLQADAFISTVDMGILRTIMAHTDSSNPRSHHATTARARLLPLHWSPSAVVLHGTVPTSISASFPHRSHHTMSFGQAWESTFDSITARAGQGRLMNDPSLMITRPAVSTPSRLITADGHSYEPISILAPVPNLSSAHIPWQHLRHYYARELLQILDTRGYTGIASALELARIDTPETWFAQGYSYGTPFSLAHTLSQTGPLRPRNLGTYPLENFILAGADTTPGVGVPTALLSGALAARRITGGGVR